MTNHSAKLNKKNEEEERKSLALKIKRKQDCNNVHRGLDLSVMNADAAKGFHFRFIQFKVENLKQLD